MSNNAVDPNAVVLQGVEFGSVNVVAKACDILNKARGVCVDVIGV